jgi:hypothetical protein
MVCLFIGQNPLRRATDAVIRIPRRGRNARSISRRRVNSSDGWLFPFIDFSSPYSIIFRRRVQGSKILFSYSNIGGGVFVIPAGTALTRFARALRSLAHLNPFAFLPRL